MIKALALMLAAGPVAAQQSEQMLDMLGAHCLPHIETGVAIAPDLELASPGATENLLDGAAGRAWVGENPALALFKYDDVLSCGVFGLGIDAQEMTAAAASFAAAAQMVAGDAEVGRTQYLKQRDDGDVTVLIVLTVPGPDVAALNAMRLPAGEWSNTVLGEN